MDITPRLKAHFSRHAYFYFVLAATFAFGLCAHAYRFLNLNFHHDSLEILENAAWQIGLGRFLQPVYWKLRGELTPPWLLGLLFLLWMSIGNYLVLRLLRFRSLTFAALLCGVLSTCLTVTFSAATYISWLDVYGMAYLLAVGAACVTVRYRRGFLLAWPLLLMSLTLYQGYFNVAVILLMIVFVRDALDGRDGKDLFLRAVQYVGALLGGVLLYFISLLAAQRLFGVTLSESSNGVARLLSGGGAVTGEVLYESYVTPLRYLLYPRTALSWPVKLINLALGLLSAGVLLRYALEKRFASKGALALTGLCIALMPFGMNLTFFISGGYYSDLTFLSFSFVYVFALLLLEYAQRLPAGKPVPARLRPLLHRAVSVMLAVVIFSGVVHANQVYLKRALEWESSLSLMTRITYDIEKTEGYIPGETPVMFEGNIWGSPLQPSRPEYKYTEGTGFFSPYIFTYDDTFRFFFRYVYGYDIPILNQETDGLELSQSPEVAAMPAYPAAGSCKNINGVVVVKLS